MSDLLSFLRFDVQINKRYFAFALALALGYAIFLGRHGSGVLALTAVMAFLGPTLIPWWTIGHDRAKGTIVMLTSLPITRLRLTTLKALEAFTISVVLGFCVAILLVAMGQPRIDLASAFLIGIPWSLSACLVSTGSFLLLSSRVAFYLLFPAYFAIMYTFGRLVYSNPFAALEKFSWVVCVTVLASLLFLVVATRIWAQRVSPCD